MAFKACYGDSFLAFTLKVVASCGVQFMSMFPVSVFMYVWCRNKMWLGVISVDSKCSLTPVSCMAFVLLPLVLSTQCLYVECDPAIGSWWGTAVLIYLFMCIICTLNPITVHFVSWTWRTLDMVMFNAVMQSLWTEISTTALQHLKQIICGANVSKWRLKNLGSRQNEQIAHSVE
jgi:hypothetical protein